MGLIALIIIPMVSIILLCTIIGIRLGFVLLLLYIIMLLIAILYASLICGNLILTKLFKSNDNSYLSIAIGVIVIKLVSIVPVIGSLVYFLVILYGMGKSIELFKNREK